MRASSFALAFCLFAQLVSAQKTETRPLASFDKIGLSGGFENVVLKQGDREAIDISASGIELDRIKTEIKNGLLNVSIKNGSYRSSEIRLTIYFKNIEEVANSGSSDVEIDGLLKAEKFEYAASGSGDFQGEMDVRNLEIALSGSSDLKLTGQADEQSISISGSGDVDAAGLKGEAASVSVSGSGDVKLNVARVKSSVSGSGRVQNRH